LLQVWKIAGRGAGGGGGGPASPPRRALPWSARARRRRAAPCPGQRAPVAAAAATAAGADSGRRATRPRPASRTAEAAASTGRLPVANEAANGREALAQARRLDPDVLLMDVRMPEVEGGQDEACACSSTRSPTSRWFTRARLPAATSSRVASMPDNFAVQATLPLAT
jgi:hypothetical protein